MLGTLPSPVLCAHGQGVVMRGMFLTCATTRNGMRSGSGPGRISIWNKRVRLTAAAAAATTSKAEATSTTGVHTGFAYATHTHTHTHTQKQQDLFVAYQQKNTHQRRRLDQHQPAARLIRLQKITAKKQKNSRRKFLAGSNIFAIASKGVNEPVCRAPCFLERFWLPLVELSKVVAVSHRNSF